MDMSFEFRRLGLAGELCIWPLTSQGLDSVEVEGKWEGKEEQPESDPVKYHRGGISFAFRLVCLHFVIAALHFDRIPIHLASTLI